MSATLDDIVAAIDVSEQLTVRPVDPAYASLELPLPLERERASLILASYLYAHYYAFDPSLCDAGARDYFTLAGFRRSNPDFVQALADANPGAGYLSPGWRVVEREADELYVEKEGVTLLASARRHLPAREQSAGPGDRVFVRFPKDSLMGAPGFYLSFSDAGPAASPKLARVYFNLHPEHAVELTRALLPQLLALDIPYTYKVMADPAQYHRRDTAVLYVDREQLKPVLAVVLAVHTAHPEAFRPECPSFTRRLGNGIASADNPALESGIEMSFGEHRCRSIANAICQHVHGGERLDSAGLRAAIFEHLREVGLDVERLHLASVDAEDHPREPLPRELAQDGD